MADFPIIFLDIHGVMTNKSSEVTFGRDSFDPVSAELLRQLVKETDARIVVTSDLAHDVMNLRDYMRYQAGKKVAHRTIDALPQSNAPRGELIDDWLTVNAHSGPYVILDNNPVVGHSLHFLLIDSEHGFKLTDKNNAAEILGVK